MLISFNHTHSEQSLPTSHAITYHLTGGRFGEHLLALCVAQWLSLKYDIPLVYKPFEYSNLLTIDRANSSNHVENYRLEAFLYTERQLLETTIPTLFTVCPFQTELDDWYLANQGFLLKKDNKSLRTALRTLIQPCIPNKRINKPDNYLTIAVHVRTGGTFDKPLLRNSKPVHKLHRYIDYVFPLKFPPDSFYIEQIIAINRLMPEKKLYIFIFTDAEQPENVVSYFKSNLSSLDPIIEYNAPQCITDNNNNGVLEDIFAMAQFDCLIRPDSSFSKIAQLLGEHQIVIYPTKAIWQHTTLKVTDVCIERNHVI